MGETLVLALALVLVIEGLLPTLHPPLWRRMFEQALQLSDGQIRFMGMASVLGVWRCGTCWPSAGPRQAGVWKGPVESGL